jgi:ABC-type phosphate/phosphonate transport system ATPase subunit
MAGVAFQHVAKVYPDGTRAIDDLTLEIEDGEFVVIVGRPAAERRPLCGWLRASKRSAKGRSGSAAGHA